MFARAGVGFMPALYLAYLDKMSEEEKNELVGLENTELRAKKICQHPYIIETLKKIKVSGGKNLEKSQELREEGNALYAAGKYNSALIKFSSALIFAPIDKVDYSLALANRSACLQLLGYQERSLEDTILAEKAGYPQDKLYKIMERRAQCLIKLGRKDEAKEEFEKANKLLDSSSLSQGAKDKFRGKMRESLSALIGSEEKKPRTDKAEETEPNIRNELLKISNPNPRYPALSSSVTVTSSPEQGRYVVATQDIPPGTVILSELPMTWVVENARVGTTCSMCLGCILILVPCKNCVHVSYCSIQCKNQAWDDHHSLECGFLTILFASGLNTFSNLALRAVCRSGGKYLLENKEEILKVCGKIPDSPCDMEKSGIFDGGDIKAGLSLVKHIECLDRDEIILRTLISALIATYLRRTRFGESIENEDESYYIAGVVYEILNSCPPNTHEIDIMQTPIKDKWSSLCEMKPIGGGLYCTAALFNHSCDPNIMRFNQGKRMVSVSCRSIRAGEKISDCYGLPWYSKPWEERQRILIKFYRFTCSCLPCKESWPVSELLAKTEISGLSRVKCSICGSIQVRRRLETEIPCSCGALIDLTEIPFDKIAKLKEELQDLLCVKMDWRKGMQVRLELETLLEKYIATPSLEHFLSNILVWRSLWTLAGSKKIVKIM